MVDFSDVWFHFSEKIYFQCSDCQMMLVIWLIIQMFDFFFLKKIYFQCSDCQMMLDEKHTCFVRDGKTFCKKDYIRCS